MDPKIAIEVSEHGLSRVRIQTDASAPADAGLDLLRRLLPALRALDRRSRQRRR
jgi:hypothetical protein